MGSLGSLSRAKTDRLRMIAAKFNCILCNNPKGDIFKDSIYSALILSNPAYDGIIFLDFLANDINGNFQSYKYIYNINTGDFVSLTKKSYTAVGRDRGLNRLCSTFYSVLSEILGLLSEYSDTLSFISIDLGPDISNGASYRSCELHKSVAVKGEWNLYIKAHSDTYKDTMQLASAKKIMGKEFEQYLMRVGEI